MSKFLTDWRFAFRLSRNELGYFWWKCKQNEPWKSNSWSKISLLRNFSLQGMHSTNSDWKEECLQTCLCLVFYPVLNLIFLKSSEKLFLWCKWSEAVSFWKALVHFRVAYLANLINPEWRNSVTWKDLIYISSFPVWNSVHVLVSFDFFEQTFNSQLVWFFQKCQSHLRSWCQMSFRIRDLNWQVGMCCEVRFASVSVFLNNFSIKWWENIFKISILTNQLETYFESRCLSLMQCINFDVTD